MKNSLKKQLEGLSLGDLVRVQWCDASIGKSLSSGIDIDVSVESWGVYLGILGEKAKHIILAQNNFRYADGFYDLDYTAIPVQWSISVTVLAKNHVPGTEAKQMLNSFLLGGRRALPRKKRQQAIRNHDD
ncbi:MAG: hypothetical protein ABSD73_08215 [Candidatus Bathyarchaeia archaeon]|jgi:hypothetical protein